MRPFISSLRLVLYIILSLAVVFPANAGNDWPGPRGREISRALAVIGAIATTSRLSVAKRRNRISKKHSNREIGQKHRSDTIRQIQSELKSLGYYDAKIDGISGRRTRKAIKQFRSSISSEKTGSLTRKERRTLSTMSSPKTKPKNEMRPIFERLKKLKRQRKRKSKYAY